MVGNTPNFTKIDILRCFLRMNKNIGRQELARELEIGEGTIRTILDLLKSKRLLESTKRGHFLTKKGSKILDHIFEIMSMPKDVTIKEVYPGSRKVGVCVRNIPKLKELVHLRDIAVKHNADGALILRFNKKLFIPESGQGFPDLENDFDFKDDDVLVVAFSDENKNSEGGALAIVVELNDFIKKFINEF